MKRKKGQQQQPGSATATTNGSFRKKLSQSGDFKRLKAKVGKSAPKAANYTDTSFQTAGLKVRDQHLTPEIQRQFSSQLSSSKGNSLESLLFQLNHHHAPAARISALKGIQNILVGNKSDGKEGVIRSNLASLVPPLSKCAFLDTDPTVRSIGRDLLRNVFVSATTASYPGATHNSALLDPFLPLYVAYVSSAFNSLHDDIRQEVTHGVQLATEFFTSSSCESTKHTAISRLLPSFARLISTSSSSSTGATNINANNIKVSKKRRKNASKAKDKAISVATNTADAKFISLRCQILKSLKSLLQWSYTGTNNNGSDFHHSIVSNLNTVNDNMADNHWIRIFGNNTSLNAVVIVNDAETRNGRPSNSSPIYSLYDLFSCGDSNIGECTTIYPYRTPSVKRPMLSVSAETVTALLNSLLNCWVEVIQRGIISASGGTVLSCYYVEELSYILSCLQELWIGILQHSPEYLYEKVARIQKHLLEAFPIKDDSGISTNLPVYNKLNASICFLLSNIIGGTANASSSTSAIPVKATTTLERIFAYMIPHLGYIMAEDSATSPSKRRTVNSQEDTDTSAILEVVSFLLLKHKNSGTYLLQPKERQTLLKKFVDTFFPNQPSDHDTTNNEQFSICYTEFSTLNATFYTTLAGRKAIVLACEVILADSHSFVTTPNVEDELQELNSNDSNIVLLQRIAFALPQLLKILGTEHLFESSVIIKTLKLIIQWWYNYIPSSVNMTDTDRSSIRTYTDYARYFLFTLRRDIALLLTTESKRYSKKKISVSIFEYYPLNMKRSIIGLIGFLKSPDSVVTDALAQICSRSFCSSSLPEDAESITSFIFETLFIIRKSLSLTSYLNFLIYSSGIGFKHANLAPAATSNNINVFSFDFTTKCVCRAILQSGCQFILPHLKTVLLSCLQQQRHQSEKTNNVSILLSLIKIRVSTMIILECAADLERMATATSITFFIPEMVEAMGPLMCDCLLPYLATLELNKQDRVKIMSTFSCLLIHEPELMKVFVAEALDRLNEPPISLISGPESERSKRRLSKVEALYLWELISMNTEILKVNDAQSKDLVGILTRSLNSL